MVVTAVNGYSGAVPDGWGMTLAEAAARRANAAATFMFVMCRYMCMRMCMSFRRYEPSV